MLVWRPWADHDEALALRTVPVTKGALSVRVTSSGTLSARTTVQVGAQVSGRVVELRADFNDRVDKGQVIAKLDESVLVAMIDQAQAAYELALANHSKAEIALGDADRQLKRQAALADQQLIAVATLETAQVTRDTAKAALAAATATVHQAHASLEQARTNLGYATIYSPVDGIVLSRAVDLGQTVQASFATPTLFTIAADLSRMQIDTAVAEGDVGRLVAGMKAEFTVDAFPGRTFDAVVRQVRNAATTTSGVVTYDAVIDLDNPDRILRPGMTANVTFVLDQIADAVKIPNAALRFKLSGPQMMELFKRLGGPPDMPGGGGPPPGFAGPPPGGGPPPGLPGLPSSGGTKLSDRKVVWKLVAGKPRPIPVKTGLTDGSTTQLVEGDVAPGDELVVEITDLPMSPAIPKIGGF